MTDTRNYAPTPPELMMWGTPEEKKAERKRDFYNILGKLILRANGESEDYNLGDQIARS
jgi:hypothetical protein